MVQLILNWIEVSKRWRKENQFGENVINVALVLFPGMVSASVSTAIQTFIVDRGRVGDDGPYVAAELCI